MEKNKQHTILETKNLSIGYQSKKVETVIASNINLKLKEGQLIGLVGANGIGKSTLLRTLTQVQPKLSGKIYLNNIALEDFSNLELAKAMSLVLTETIASKNVTVFELVALGRQPYTNWVGNLSEADITIINKAITQTNIETITNVTNLNLSQNITPKPKMNLIPKLKSKSR